MALLGATNFIKVDLNDLQFLILIYCQTQKTMNTWNILEMLIVCCDLSQQDQDMRASLKAFN